MRQVCTNYQSEIAEINGEEDDVHFLLRYPPTVVLSSLIGAIKSQGASAALDASVLCIGAKIPAPSGRTDSFSAPPAEPRWKFSSSTSKPEPLTASSITYPPSTEGLRDRIRSC
jgi:REP element-mobilizing transposase RayT